MDWLDILYLGAAPVVLGVWTFVLRAFPSILVRNVEHELASDRAAVKSSIDYLAAAQADMRSRTIDSVESLWQSLEATEYEFVYPISFDIQLTREERESFMSGGNVGDQWETARTQYQEQYAIESRRLAIKDKCKGTEVLFVGPTLWALYEAALAIQSASARLFADSIRKGRYMDWRDDRLIRFHAKGHVPEEVFAEAKAREQTGLSSIADWLRAEFIKEAAEVIRGTKEVEHSVQVIYASLQATRR